MLQSLQFNSFWKINLSLKPIWAVFLFYNFYSWHIHKEIYDGRILVKVLSFLWVVMVTRDLVFGILCRFCCHLIQNCYYFFKWKWTTFYDVGFQDCYKKIYFSGLKNAMISYIYMKMKNKAKKSHCLNNSKIKIVERGNIG